MQIIIIKIIKCKVKKTLFCVNPRGSNNTKDYHNNVIFLNQHVQQASSTAE